MNVGNVWEYVDFMGETSQVWVAGPVDRPNGKTYMEYLGTPNAPLTGLFRIDDDFKVWKYREYADVCDSEYVRYDLALPDSTFWTQCFYPQIFGLDFPCLSKTFDWAYFRLQVEAPTKEFCGVLIDTFSNDTSYCESFFFSRDWLAHGVGLTYLMAEAGTPQYLNGAIIDGTQYGHVTGKARAITPSSGTDKTTMGIWLRAVFTSIGWKPVNIHRFEKWCWLDSNGDKQRGMLDREGVAIIIVKTA